MAYVNLQFFNDTRDADFRGFGYGLIAAGAWALYTVSSRMAVEAGFSATDLTAIRYVVAAIAFLPMIVSRGIGDLGGIGWFRGLILAIGAGPVFSLFYVYGLSVTPYSHGPVILPSTVTLMSIVLAGIFLKERISAVYLVAAAAVIAGLYFVVSAGENLLAQASGADFLFVCAGFLWATYTILLRKWKLDPVLATASVALISGIFMLPLLIANGDWQQLTANPLETSFHAVMQGLVAAGVAVIAFSKAVRLIGASRAGLFPSLVPVLAILIGIPVLQEVPDLVQILGVLMATGGLMITALAK